MTIQRMIRLLEENDYYKGFLSLIDTFTRVKTRDIPYEEFVNIYKTLKEQNAFVYVIEQDNKIVSTLKVFYEQKFHNNLSSVAHIEDVVTLPDYRGQGLASSLIRYAIDQSKGKCYKIILCANEKNIPFYTHLGFQKKGAELSIYHI